MSRGGKRDNAGRKSGWINAETKLIRVPVAIESQLMAIAKKLDRGEIIDLETKSIETELVTEFKVDSVTNSENTNTDSVTESKVYEVKQFELIPSVSRSSKLEPLSQPDLAIRLKVSVRAMRNHKDDFAEWSKAKDPDRIAWERHEDKKYYPLNQ
ncbi:MAG TPA: hypothetical protein V6D33_15330 [Cyanophyceae cyanobacterium]